MARFGGVLFDLDGTLIDSLGDLADATNAAIERRGFPTHPLDAYRRFVGDGARQLVARALPPDAPVDLDQVVAEMRGIYAGRWAVRTRLYPGIDAMLDGLRGRRLGILSNKPDDLTVRIAAHFFAGRFDPVRGARDDTPLKPAPDAAWRIAEAWGVAAESILFVGDSGPDVGFAKNAGMVCVGVSWGFRGRTELEGEGADVVIDAAEEFLPALARLEASR